MTSQHSKNEKQFEEAIARWLIERELPVDPDSVEFMRKQIFDLLAQINDFGDYAPENVNEKRTEAIDE